MKRVIVLGAGMVGAVMARDLSEDSMFSVTVADIDELNLEKASRKGNIKTIKADLSKPVEVKRLVTDFDLVCGALSSLIGFSALRAVIESGKDYCDISFMPEDAMDLDSLAKKKGVTAVVDCGVAPGMSNMLCGHANSYFDKTENVEIYVGGLPVVRTWPYQYKAAFSPVDVIEEYTRPSRFIVDGKIVTKPALTDPELMDFPGIGMLEAFNTDGLRSLLKTINAPRVIEKTLRYPGHIELMRVLRETGFFEKDTIDIGGVKISPLALTSKLLFKIWKYEGDEEDLTVMRVIAEGMKDGKRVRLVWDLLDGYDPIQHETSMSRTTAFPNAIVARMVASGEYKNPGVNPPEFIGRNKALLDKVLDELSKRGVKFESNFAR